MTLKSVPWAISKGPIKPCCPKYRFAGLRLLNRTSEGVPRKLRRTNSDICCRGLILKVGWLNMCRQSPAKPHWAWAVMTQHPQTPVCHLRY